jgi:hypothetical protein
MSRLWLAASFSAICFLAFVGLAAPPAVLVDGDLKPPGEEETGCVAPGEWFGKGGTPEASYTTDLRPDNDCDFYRFAWQTFLFVTDPAQGQDYPRFLDFATPEEVFGDIATPTFPKKRNRGELVLSPRVVKSKGMRDIDTIFQAVSGGVVVDKNGRALYYGLHMNEAFVKFLSKNNLTTADGIAKARADLMFEPGCLEFKSAWRVVAKGENTSTLITRMAKLPVLTTKGGKVTVDPDQEPRQEKVALVSLHVVGVAKGHPEFIWATFEHIRNAPELPVDLLNREPFDALPKGISGVVAEEAWTFCPEGTLAKDCSIQTPPAVRLISEADQTLAPVTPIFRYYAFGGDNPRGVSSLNASVHEKLAKGDVRRNYEMIGAVWIDRPLDRDGQEGTFVENKPFDNDVLAGATKLSSSTMETFTQITPGEKNCFGCHDTQSVLVPGTTTILDGKRINVSHMILRAFGNAKQKELAAKR